MQFRLTYTEISQMIAQKTGQQIPLCYGGPHTITIAYDAKVLIKTMQMSLNITVERVLGTDIRLSYSGSMGVDMMVKAALNQIKNRPEGAMIETLDGNLIVLHLGMNPQLSQIFQQVILQDIFFDEEFVIIEFIKR